MRYGLRFKLGILTFLTLITICGKVQAWQTDVYYASRIWTGQGEPIVDGVLVTIDGKVSAVGPRTSVQIPDDARHHRLGNQVIIPGLVVAQTNLTGTSDVEQTLTPEIQAVDGFDFYADHHQALGGGVTTVQISPGNNRLMPGMGAVVKLGGPDPTSRVLSKNESLRIVLDKSTRNPPTIYEPPVGPVSVDRPLLPTRPQLSKTLAGALSGIRLIFKNATADQRYVSAEPETVVETVAGHLTNQGTVRFTAETAPEIRGALELARTFNLRIVIADCKSLSPFADRFDDWQGYVRGVVLAGLAPGKITNPPAEDLEEQILPWEFARELIDAGIPLAVRPATDNDLSQMLFVAGQFMQDELTRAELLSMITSWPAKMLGVDSRVGTLASGKDADFVVLSGDPFQLHSTVNATFLGGNKVFEVKSNSRTTVVRGAQIYTGTGAVIDEGAIVIKGNTIRGVGTDVSAPTDAEVADFAGGVIVPGFVDLGSSLGIGGSLSGNVSLNTKLGEQLYADDPAIDAARRNGVTTVLLGSMNTDGPTPMVAFKLGDDARVVADPVAIRFRIGTNPGSSVATIDRALKRGKEYVDSWKKYEEELAEYQAKKAEADKKSSESDVDAKQETESEKVESDNEKEETEKEPADGSETRRRRPTGQDGQRGASQRRRRPGSDGEPNEVTNDEQTNDGAKQDEPSNEKKEDKEPELKEPKKPEVRDELEPYRALFAGDIPVFVEARRADAIKAALKIFRQDYDLRTVIVGADDLARMPDLLNNQNVAVSAGPDLMVEIDKQKTNMPQLLATERIPFAFHSNASTGVGQLPSAVQFSISQGLGVADGLQALTSAPANMLSQTMNFGRLATGSDADLVVLSGQPFEHSTKVLAVMIDGNWVYHREDKK